MFAYLLLVLMQYLLLPKFLLLNQGLPCFTVYVMVAVLLLGKQTVPKGKDRSDLCNMLFRLS